MTRWAALDLGSNTVKMTIADVSSESLRPIGTWVEPTRVVEGKTDGVLAAHAIQRTLEALQRFDALCAEHGVEARTAVATASLRGARNADVLLGRIPEWPIEIISGVREAHLSALGPSSILPPGAMLVVDVGGKSTELVQCDERNVEWSVSLEVGAISASARVPEQPSPAELEVLDAALDAMMKLPAPARGLGVAVSGSAVAALALRTGATRFVELEPHEGAEVSSAFIAAERLRLAALPASARIVGEVIPPLRADVIVGGLSVLLAVTREAGLTALTVTQRGVRFGLLVEAQRKMSGA